MCSARFMHNQKCPQMLPHLPSSEMSEPRHSVTFSGYLHEGTPYSYFCILSHLCVSSGGPVTLHVLLAEGAEAQEEPSAISVGLAVTRQDTQMSP